LEVSKELMRVPDSEPGGLQGRTLKVYLFVVKERNPVGPREVMRGVSLTSPSVAYRHLQKLETMGLIVKNEFGNYVAKEKATVRGYVWVGRRLIPNAIVYSLVFLFILFWELVVFILHFSVETDQFKIFFFLLMAITISAIVLFTIEGLRSQRRTRIQQSESS
jgi:hypothetical protein